jgi:hypothetical protein
MFLGYCVYTRSGDVMALSTKHHHFSTGKLTSAALFVVELAGCRQPLTAVSVRRARA